MKTEITTSEYLNDEIKALRMKIKCLETDIELLRLRIANRDDTISFLRNELEKKIDEQACTALSL